MDEFLVFIGASYFRAIPKDAPYGLSARGLSINSALPGMPEEFPDFSEFHLEKPEKDSKSLKGGRSAHRRERGGCLSVHDHSGTGNRDGHRGGNHAARPVSQLGLAPFSSMFWFGESTHPKPYRFPSGSARQRRPADGAGQREPPLPPAGDDQGPVPPLRLHDGAAALVGAAPTRPLVLFLSGSGGALSQPAEREGGAGRGIRPRKTPPHRDADQGRDRRQRDPPVGAHTGAGGRESLHVSTTACTGCAIPRPRGFSRSAPHVSGRRCKSRTRC